MLGRGRGGAARDAPLVAAATAALGVAGPFVGTHGGALFVAGNVNFPVPVGGDRWDVPKVWHADAWVLVPNAAGEPEWRAAPPLERRTAYNASASTPECTVWIGGDDGREVFADVMLVTWDAAAGRLRREALPPLSPPMTCGGAAAIGSAPALPGGSSP